MAKIKINRRKDYKEQLKLYLNLSKSLNAKVKKLFRKTARKAEQEYLKYEDMYYFFLEDFSDDFYKILSSHYRAVITASSERIIKQREKKAEGSIDKIVEKYINENTATKVAEVSETTRQNIKRSIKKKISEGKSIPVIARELRQNNGFKPYRATMIARTETHMAMNYANDEISKTLGFKDPVKEWNSATDDRTRGWHRAMNGTVVKQDEMFKVMTPIAGGGSIERRMSYTGDRNGGALNVINCRCFTLRYDSEDEVIGATPKPDSPILPVDVGTVAVTTTVPQVFVGFGRTTKKEKEYHEQSWENTGVEKNIIAKFEEVPITDVKGKDAYFLGYDNKVDSINMPNSYVSYELQSTWRHEYGHNADFQAFTKLVFDPAKSDSNFRGWGQNMTSSGKVLEVTAKNKVSAKAIKLRAESPKMDNIRYASQIYTKEVIEDSAQLTKKFGTGKLGYSKIIARKEELDKNKVLLFRRNNIDTQNGKLTGLENAEKRKKFLNDVIEDGEVFKRQEILDLYDTKLLSELSEEEFKYIANGFVDFNYYNKKGIIGNYDNSNGVVNSLKKMNNFISPKNRLTVKMFETNKEDLLFFADYLGAITKEKVGYGHKISYYEKASLPRVKIGRRVVGDRETTEAYANYISLSGSPNKEIWKNKMQELTPNVKEGFDELTEEILKLPNID